MQTEPTLIIPQDILASAHLTLDDVKVELAIHLYEQNLLSVGKARELADLPLWTFRQLLAARRIPVHYSVEDLNADVETLKSMNLL